MFNEEDRKWLYDQFKDNGYDTGSYEDFTKSLDSDEDFEWWHDEAVGLGLEVGDLNEFNSLFRAPKTPSSNNQEEQLRSIEEAQARFGGGTESRMPARFYTPTEPQETKAEDKAEIARLPPSPGRQARDRGG